MAWSRETQDRQPLYGAAIPLARPVKLDRGALAEELRAVVQMAGAGGRIADDAPARRGLLSSLTGQADEIRVEIAGMKLSISMVPKPLCSPTAMHAFVNPMLWKGGVGGITGHKAHLMISEAESFTGGNGRDAMFDRATAVTLVAAAVASLGGGEGVVWLPGRNALPLSTFGSEMERFIDGQAPLLFWVRSQIIPAPTQAEREFGQLSGEALQPGIATTGLTAFIGAEMIAPPSHLDRDVMLDHIFALASLVIDENKDLSDGLLIGSGSGQARVIAREHGRYSKRPYWEIEPAKKPAVRAAPRPVPQPEAQPAPQHPHPQAVPSYPSAPPQAAPSHPSVPQRPQAPGLPPMPDHGLGPNLGLLPKSAGALVDPDDVLRAAMQSADPMDALPAALRPSRHDANRPAAPGPDLAPPPGGGMASTPSDPMNALPAAHRPSANDPNRRAVLGPDPALTQGGDMTSSPSDPDEALPAALRPVRPPAGPPPPIPEPGAKAEPAPAEPSPKPRPDRPSAMGRRFAKRLPATDAPDHGSLGTDIPRPSADERFSETPAEPEPEPEAEEDESLAAKLRLVVPGGRR